jgi:autotransporter-associated beta strand protein
MKRIMFMGAVVLAIGAGELQGVTCTWTNGAAGNWNLSSGWSNGVPTASHDANFVGAGLTLTNEVAVNSFALSAAIANNGFTLGLGGAITVSNVTTGLIGPIDYSGGVGGFAVQQTNTVADVVLATTVGSRGLTVSAGAASQTARLTITPGMTWNPNAGLDSIGPRVKIGNTAGRSGSLTLQGTITTSKGLSLGVSASGTGSAEFILDGGTLIVNLIQREAGGSVNTDIVNFEFRSGVIRNSSNAGMLVSNLNTSTTLDLKLGTTGAAVFDATNGNINVDASVRLVDLTSGGGFAKIGTGTLTLGGANTYSGTAIVSNGVLQLANASGASLDASSSLNVVYGGVFNDAYSTGRDLTFAAMRGGGTFKVGAATSKFIVTSTLAPGDAGVGTMTISNGCVQLAAGASFALEVGGTTANPSNDWVNLTEASSTVSFAGAWTVNVTSVGSVEPNGKTFVLFDYAGAHPTIGTQPSITYSGGTRWTGGQVSVDESNSRVVLTGVVTRPTGALLSVW